jgi:hypothetical protein
MGGAWCGRDRRIVSLSADSSYSLNSARNRSFVYWPNTIYEAAAIKEIASAQHWLRMQQMRLLHVITALGVGGAENMLLKLLTARSLAHIDQRVVAMLPGGAMAAPMRAVGAVVDELNLLGGVPVVTGSAQLARLARRFQPQLDATVRHVIFDGVIDEVEQRRVQQRAIRLNAHCWHEFDVKLQA